MAEPVASVGSTAAHQKPVDRDPAAGISASATTNTQLLNRATREAANLCPTAASDSELIERDRPKATQDAGTAAAHTKLL